jgi:hypothetical protein
MRRTKEGSMRKGLISLGLSVIMLLGLTGVAQAVHHYSNCTAMHRDHSHGVARSTRAANAEVADGYGRPFVSRRLYRANSDLDANNDGVACES